MQVTTLDRLKAIKQTEVIELPPFLDGTPFVAEVKKPNMMQLMTSGKIPNELLTSAMTMFNGKTNQLTNKVNENDIGSLKELVGLLDILTEHCLVNPSLKDIKEIGIELTQEQMMGVLIYTQGGIEALKSFRMQSEHNEGNKAVAEIPEIAESNS